MHVSEAPLLLGRVCRRWRDVVYDTAELWSAVHVATPLMSHSQHYALRLEALEKWLSRSGNLALRISLYANYASGDVTPFLDLIISLSQRWERIALVIPSTYFKQLAQSFSGDEALLHLRTFQLGDRLPLIEFPHIASPGNHADSIDPLRLLTLCPKIQCISILLSEGSLYPLLPSSVATSLQELDIDFPTMFNCDLNRLLSFLTGCQSLRKLRIITPFHELAFPAPSITLPLLECLIVNMFFNTAFATIDNAEPPVITFLNHLVTPKLLYLEVLSTVDVNTAATSLNNLFARSSCPLRTLTLYMENSNVEQGLRPLSSCLEYTNDLRKLTISNRAGNDKLFVHLAYSTDGGTNYCPNLTHFKLGNYIDLPLDLLISDLSSLLDFARSRVNPPPGCASLEVLDLQDVIVPFQYFDSLFDPFLESVEELREQGLKFLLPPDPLEHHPLVSPWYGLPIS